MKLYEHTRSGAQLLMTDEGRSADLLIELDHRLSKLGFTVSALEPEVELTKVEEEETSKPKAKPKSKKKTKK